MARATYGERMLAWEDEQDQKAWKNALKEAITSKHYDVVETLLKEGLSFDYDIPLLGDEIAEKILNKLIHS